MKFQYCLVLFIVSSLIFIQYSHSASAQQQQVYYVYVEPIPDYATSYASNVIHDATSAWQDANPNLKFSNTDNQDQADVVIQWIKDYGDVNGRAGETIYGKIIQIGLGDSNCLKRWQPYSTNTVTHIAQHELGHFLGFQHSSDPNSIMYPTTTIQYGMIEIENNVSTNYGWFVPACTQQNVTSFNYKVSTSDPTYGFDVYFVPSKDELDSWGKGQGFQYYSGDGCLGKNYLKFGGTCNGVAKGSGLLILTHDQLTSSLATITVQLEEGTSSVSTAENTNSFTPQLPNPSPQLPNPSPQPPSPPVPTPTPSPSNGFVKVDKNQYLVSVGELAQVTVYGKVEQPKGGKVVLTIAKPDGTSDVLQAYVTNIGDFSIPIILDRYSSTGQYQIHASYQSLDFGSATFNVTSGVSTNGSTPNPVPHPNPSKQTQNATKPSPTLQPNPLFFENILQVEGTHFSVPFSITSGSVLGITADTGSKSLIIPIHTTSSGTFAITMPRVLIDAKNGGQDDKFFVLINGIVSTFNETKTYAERTLTIQFPSGTTQIEIIGTKIVPEFGELASITLAIMVVLSIFILSTRNKLTWRKI